MDWEAVGIAVLGLVLGPLALLAHNFVAERLSRNNPDPALRTNRGQAQFIFSAAAGLVAMAGIMVGVPWLLGLVPLYSRGPLFIWSFLIGAAMFSIAVRVVHHFRRLHAGKSDS